MGGRGSRITREEGNHETNSCDDTTSRGVTRNQPVSEDAIIPSHQHRVVPLEIATDQPSPQPHHGHGPPNLASPQSFLNSSSSDIAIHHSIPAHSSSQLLTPRREDNLYNKISYTPIGDQLSVYKYYCPLCMSFYQDIFTSSACCRHYICSECIVDYLAKRNCLVNTLNDILMASPYQNLACPHCNTVGFSPALVLPHETVRNYLDSTTPAQQISYPSPMKIGDSFEDMKRKMASISEKNTISVSSKPLLPPSGNKIRQFSPDADIIRLVDPLPFPSLDELGIAHAESHSNPPSYRGSAEAGPSPYCATPLRGIAITNSTAKIPSESSGSSAPPSIHDIASNFVLHLLRSNEVDTRRPSLKESDDTNLQWISSLFPSPMAMVRRESKSKILPLSDEDPRQHSPSPRMASVTSTTPRTEKEVHQFATLFVHNILPNQ